MKDWRNTLATDLTELLDARPGGVSEMELIRELRARGCAGLPEIDGRDLYSLFRTHFRIFHVLYRLRDQWRRQRFRELVPDPLCIRVLPWHAGAEAVTPIDALRDFYADLEQLDRTGPEDVAKLVTGLARRREKAHRRDAALSFLGLETGAGRREIRRRYRRLAMDWHPDRGGDAERFQQLQTVMADLDER